MQINSDATAVAQAGNGTGYLQEIIAQQVMSYLGHAGGATDLPVNFVVRVSFNPDLKSEWFTSVMQIINSITMLAIILTGAALRTRNH